MVALSATAALPVPRPRPRLMLVDVVRGSAVLLMFVYHFAYDLNYFGLVRLDMNHAPFWLNFRTLIVSLFLLTMGVSLHLATRNGPNARAFMRRLAWLGGYAALVSLVSYLMFPDSMIFFGILHFIAVASVLGLLFAPLYWGNLVLGLGLIGLGLTFQHPVFDQPVLQWLGLMTHKPITEDYVPLLPWFGVVLVGLFVGKAVFAADRPRAPARWEGRHPAVRLLAWTGRHSLHIYMLHQPVFMGVLYAALVLAGR